MPVSKTITTGKVPVKIWTDHVEDPAFKQLEEMSQMDFVYPHIAVMPDVHLGKGATIGSVIPTRGAIIPAAVGVDLGCGMMACRTDLVASDLPDNLSGIRAAIEAAVPHGRTHNGAEVNDLGGWRGNVPRVYRYVWETHLAGELDRIATESPDLMRAHTNSLNHFGTLGTGNHFIEICLDELDRVWIMLHTGSRGVGNRIGSYFIEKAKEETAARGIDVPNKDLAFLSEDSPMFTRYLNGISWAQGFAELSRVVMMSAAVTALGDSLKRHVSAYRQVVACHHNYVARETHFGEEVWVTRKGAVSAREGELGIIPGSMGAKSYIVEGLGNADSLCSCSHGAGRTMSRTAAKKAFTAADLAAATDGIECRKDDEVVDEIPQAYKDIDVVMNHQKDLVKVLHTLRQIVNVKG